MEKPMWDDELMRHPKVMEWGAKFIEFYNCKPLVNIGDDKVKIPMFDTCFVQLIMKRLIKKEQELDDMKISEQQTKSALKKLQGVLQ